MQGVAEYTISIPRLNYDSIRKNVDVSPLIIRIGIEKKLHEI
jgi:hypothetical protein